MKLAERSAAYSSGTLTWTGGPHCSAVVPRPMHDDVASHPHPPTRSRPPTHSDTPTHPHTHKKHSHTHTYIHTHTHTLSVHHAVRKSLSLSLSSHTHRHTRSRARTHARTHAHARTHTLGFCCCGLNHSHSVRASTDRSSPHFVSQSARQTPITGSRRSSYKEKGAGKRCSECECQYHKYHGVVAVGNARHHSAVSHGALGSPQSLRYGLKGDESKWASRACR